MLTRPVCCLARLGIVGAMVVLLTGCPEDAADIVEVKATSLDFDVAPLPLVSFSTGAVSIDNLVLVTFDTTVADAFDRSTDATPAYVVADRRWVWGGPAHRAVDGRAPTLLQTDPVVMSSIGLLVESPAAEGGAYYNIWVSGVMDGLPPNSQYTVAFVRYGVDVKAELDQAAILMGEPITQPDSLVVLNPNPLGDPNVDINYFTTGNDGDTIPAQPGANPFIIGNATTDGTGNSDLGIMISATDAISGGNPYFWTNDQENPPTAAMLDSAMFGRNDGVAFAPTSYNYIVMFEGLGVTGRTIARWQVAQDLDLSGQPLNNGFYPYPTAAYTLGQLIGAPGGAGRPDSITVDILKAEPTAASAVWQAWLVNRDEEPVTAVPATATYQRVAIVREIHEVTGEIISEKDSVLEATPQTSNFQGELIADLGGDVGEQEIKHRLIISDATVGGGSGPGFFTDVVVTLEESAGATTPSQAMALWHQYTDQGGTPANYFDDSSAGGTLVFGHFDPDDPTASTTFTEADIAQASGVGGVVAVTHDSVEVSVEMKNLPLPPVGYYYEGWLVGPNGNTFSFGPIRALPPDTTSLFHADTATTLPSVTPTGIRYAVARGIIHLDAVIGEEGGEFTINLTNFYLTLEPKVGAAPKNIADIEVGLLPTEAMIRRMGG